MIKLDKKLRIGFTVFSILGVLTLADAKPINVNAELGTQDLIASSYNFTAGVDSLIYEDISEEDIEEANSFAEINSEMWTTEYVNMHDACSKDADIIKSIRVGDKVFALSYENDYWCKVEYDGQIGYICSDYLSTTSPYMKVSSTAYCNPKGNKTADCSNTIAGLTLAGKKEWLGRGCYIYNVAKDGSIGSCRGYYEFHDTGWGRDGDILRGETVDIYMTTKDECITYGRQDIYILFVD